VLQNLCGAARNVVVLSLRGRKSNRDAIGARVELDGQVKWVAAGSAYVSQHTKRLHFGLGERGRAEKLRIHWPSGETQELAALAAGFLYEVTEGSGDVRSRPLRPRREWPGDAPFPVENQARLGTAWLWEPVPLAEKRRGPAVLVVHAGEPLPRLPVNVEAVDLRQAPADLAAAYAVLRRYLFDYRTDLETPLWLLIDGESRVRKIYAEAPDAATAEADLRLAEGPVPERRALPFDGFYTANPRRDYYKFGGALLQAGYPGRALPYLEEALRRAPDNAIHHLTLGQVLLQLGRAEEARAHVEFAVKNRPQSPEAWNNLGGVEMAKGDARAALGHFLKALEIRPDSPYALVNAGQAYARLGDVAAAEKMLRRALEVDPNDADAANQLGLLLAKSGRLEEGKRLFQRAIEIDRAHTGAINNLGVLYVNLKQPEEAIAAFEYGIQAAPGSEIMYMNLARVYVAMGNPDKARDVLERLRDRVPDSETARRALEELSNR
jgi:tetratricopeptide (TPR) repeat protein